MFAVKIAAKHFESLAIKSFVADDLSFTEGLVIAATFLEAPDPTRPSQLAETLGTTRSNVSHAVSALEAKGLVMRKIDPEDARGYLVTLKPSGRKCAVHVVAAFDTLQRAFEKQVGREPLANVLQVLRDLQNAQHRMRIRTT